MALVCFCRAQNNRNALPHHTGVARPLQNFFWFMFLSLLQAQLSGRSTGKGSLGMLSSAACVVLSAALIWMIHKRPLLMFLTPGLSAEQRCLRHTKRHLRNFEAWHRLVLLRSSRNELNQQFNKEIWRPVEAAGLCQCPVWSEENYLTRQPVAKKNSCSSFLIQRNLLWKRYVEQGCN